MERPTNIDSILKYLEWSFDHKMIASINPEDCMRLKVYVEELELRASFLDSEVDRLYKKIKSGKAP